MDAKPSEAHRTQASDLGFAQAQTLSGFELVVAAPGVPWDHPDLQLLRDQGLEVIGEAELAYRTVPTPLIGVTGTAGKGSTTSWIAHLLCGQGLDARAGGNIDPPLLDVVPLAEVAVAELSSFQLERVQSFRSAVAVLTNLGVDHLDRHGTVAAYHEAKLRWLGSLESDDYLVIPQELYKVVAERTQARVVCVHDEGPLLDLAAREVLSVDEVPGHQHVINARLAMLAVFCYLERLGKTPDLHALRDGLRNFRGLAGRFEIIAVIDGVQFIDDSIATRTLAAQAALLRAPGPVAWIVGGRDKGADLEPLLEVVRAKVARIIGIGESGSFFADYFARYGVSATVVPEADGAQALEQAVCLAWDVPGRASVLLAPLGTSFDQFRSYEHRGAVFREVVKRFADTRTSQGTNEVMQ